MGIQKFQQNNFQSHDIPREVETQQDPMSSVKAHVCCIFFRGALETLLHEWQLSHMGQLIHSQEHMYAIYPLDTVTNRTVKS